MSSTELRYFAIISIAFCFGLVWFARRAEHADRSTKTAMDLALPVMIAGFLGARLFHVLIEEPKLYFTYPSQILRVWEGGFVWYGGAICGALAGIITAKRKREPISVWMDLSAPVIAAGYSLGRMACWFEGCCYGRFCTLPGEISFQFPSQLFAVTWEAGLAFYLLLIERNKTNVEEPPGFIFATYLIGHGFGRVLMELSRADERGPQLGPVTVSILISFALIAAGFVWRKRLKTVPNSKISS